MHRRPPAAPATVPAPRAPEAASDPGPSDVDALLVLARRQLGLPVAFLSRFDGDERELRALSSDEPLPIGPGFREPLHQTHCARVVAGTMPRVVPDVASTPSARDGVAAVAAFGIGAFVGVPVHLPDGELYGTLCCLGFAPEPSLVDRDERTLGVLATAVGVLLAAERRAEAAHRAVEERVTALLAAGGPQLVLQPVRRLDTLEQVGGEVLSRIPGSTAPVERCFADARRVGRAVDLDLRVLHRALPLLADPRHTGYLAVNVTPPTLVDPRLAEALHDAPLDRLVLEITEHDPVDDHALVVARLAPLRARGLRLAVDDAGAGYASLRHVLALAPDVVKVDRSVVTGLHRHEPRRALVGALVAFTRTTGAVLVAEGVEAPAELRVLRDLGVPCGQGWLLGRPEPVPAVAPAARVEGPAAQRSGTLAVPVQPPS